MTCDATGDFKSIDFYNLWNCFPVFLSHGSVGVFISAFDVLAAPWWR